MCSNTLPPKATKHVPFVQVSTSLVTNSWCIHVYVQVSSLIPRLYCHFIKFKWSNFMFDTCLCVVPFLWQQQTTQLPKLNSHNEACLFICQSFQPELLEDGEQQVPLAFSTLFLKHRLDSWPCNISNKILKNLTWKVVILYCIPFPIDTAADNQILMLAVLVAV